MGARFFREAGFLGPVRFAELRSVRVAFLRLLLLDMAATKEKMPHRGLLGKFWKIHKVDPKP